MKRAIVTGAGGFIGGHLVKKLKREGYWVRGVDIKEHEFADTDADEFFLCDLREVQDCWEALYIKDGFDEVYNLAATMGGMGFISSAECRIMRDNTLINNNMITTAVKLGIPRYFFSSSVCVYRDMEFGEVPLDEDGAYPAQPDNEYGWEKLYAERTALTYARHYPIEVRIARFQNIFGPEGTWCGGREKAPAAICRKVARAQDDTSIEVWGDGSALRCYTYVDDLVDGVYLLMQSDIGTPTNIGSDGIVSVNDLAQTIIDVSGKNLTIKHVDGPVGVQARYFKKDKIKSLGWKPRVSFRKGIEQTYHWIEQEVQAWQHMISRL